MKQLISFCMIGILSGCSALPEFFQTIDDIATNDAITVEVDKDAIKKDTDVHITVDVVNKDETQKVVSK